MKILIEKSFAKDVNKIKDKKLLQNLSNIITELDDSKSLREISNIKKIKGYKSFFRHLTNGSMPWICSLNSNQNT